MGKKIGIDFGTTNSASMYVDDNGVVRLIENNEGSYTTSSSVFFDSFTKEFIVGNMAEEEGVLCPENLLRCIKSMSGDPECTFNFDGKDYSSQYIVSLILQKLISDAEIYFGGEEIDGAVFSIPIYWGTRAKVHFLNAVKSVRTRDGKPLKILKIITETGAISRAYMAYNPGNYQKTILIYDLGGATFDTAIVKLSSAGDEQKFTVCGCDGCHVTGGMNWTYDLKYYVIEQYCDLNGEVEDDLWERIDPYLLFLRTESAKCVLSKSESAIIPIEFNNGNREYIRVTREQFEKITQHYLDYTLSIVDKMLVEHAQTGENDIDEIFLVGGACRMPQVERRLKEKYNKPVNVFQPELVVAKGAAIVANCSTDTLCD